ncbi:hypothetical protein DY000_02013512 [Brassica cretica]|uniref:RNase H type-1 domain-containing protein n=1 Tax=Brassica cretica TaxID=69181 RepID=A0ABQ7D159_BRACR|nr:hypothetical protein DY000_02013512 [Brassica cretica]
MSAPKYQMSALETYLNWCGVFDMTNVSMETNVIAANLDNKSEALSVSDGDKDYRNNKEAGEATMANLYFLSGRA